MLLENFVEPQSKLVELVLKFIDHFFEFTFGRDSVFVVAVHLLGEKKAEFKSLSHPSFPNSDRRSLRIFQPHILEPRHPDNTLDICSKPPPQPFRQSYDHNTSTSLYPCKTDRHSSNISCTLSIFFHTHIRHRTPFLRQKKKRLIFKPDSPECHRSANHWLTSASRRSVPHPASCADF